MRGSLSLPSLFLGITPGQARQHLLPLIKSARRKYPRFVVPCAGRFTGALIALKAGYPPEAIHASDVSLFSSFIGTLASGGDVRRLVATVALPDAPEIERCANETTDPFEHAAAVLLAMKVAATPGATVYASMLRSDLIGGWRRHLEKLKQNLIELAGTLKGIHYQPRCMLEVVEQDSADAGAMLYVDPPGFGGGYEKLFNSKGVVAFEPPPMTKFDPKTGFTLLREMTKDAPALVILLQAIDDDDQTPSDAIWGMQAGERLKTLSANRKAEVVELSGVRVSMKTEKTVNPRWPVWGSRGDRIRADSKIEVEKTTKEISLYYRDLFAHTLGATNAERYFLIWVDGKVFGTFGMHLNFATMGRFYDEADPRLFAWESFGFSARHPTYRKYLNRLLMMCVTCDGFLELLKRTTRFPMGDPVGVRTACITKGHESKGNRGILKLMSRELLPDGRHHIVYATEWRKGTFQDQLVDWFNKYGLKEE
jgi:hypothetical protein